MCRLSPPLATNVHGHCWQKKRLPACLVLMWYHRLLFPRNINPQSLHLATLCLKCSCVCWQCLWLGSATEGPSLSTLVVNCPLLSQLAVPPVHTWQRHKFLWKRVHVQNVDTFSVVHTVSLKTTMRTHSFNAYSNVKLLRYCTTWHHMDANINGDIVEFQISHKI